MKALTSMLLNAKNTCLLASFSFPRVLVFLLILKGMFVEFAQAQVPPSFSYQGILRSANGVPMASRNVVVRLSLSDSAAGSAVLYRETHAVTTSSVGGFQVNVGQGVVQSGAFQQIAWESSPKVIRTEVDTANGVFIDFGTSNFSSVPYVLRAQTIGNGIPAGGNHGQILTRCAGQNIWTTNGQCPTPTVGTLNCAGVVNNGSLFNGFVASNVSSAIAYTGGNDAPFLAYSVVSTGITGLTATLSSGTLASSGGNLIFNISGTPSGIGNAIFPINFGGQVCSLSRAVTILPPVVASLNCSNVVNTGNLFVSTPASSVTCSLPYTGGNGGSHALITVASTGVTGLTASLAAGSIAIGNGNLVYTISGTPATSGTASFNFQYGGQTCTITRTVNPLGPTNASCGTATIHSPFITYGSMTDQEGNTYRTIQVTTASGRYEWMAENLRTRTYRNGVSIPLITDATAWSNASANNSPGRAWFNNDSAGMNCPRGSLYNYTAVMSNNGICPTGWFVPSNSLFGELATLFGGNSVAGGRMKSTGTQFWLSPNTSADNSSGFSGLPGGYRVPAGTFSFLRGTGYWWATDGYRTLSFDNAAFASNNNLSAGHGLSVRCARQVPAAIQSMDCGSVVPSSPVYQAVQTSQSITISYTGGNGGFAPNASFSSTGVTGLSLVWSGGASGIANGNGTFNFTLQGTPSDTGTASFAISMAGQSCTLRVSVSRRMPVYCNGSPTEVIEVTNPTTGRIWMDRNLGATTVADINGWTSTGNGSLYQWGRSSDGHQCFSTSTLFLSSSDQVEHSGFIVSTSLPFDWRSPQNNNLWQGLNGINNPCPIGFRIPTVTELSDELASWSVQNRNGAIASPLKLPSAERRNSNGNLTASSGTIGSYWSSTVNGQNSQGLFFDSNSASILSFGRASGLSVRCIKEAAAGGVGSINTINCTNPTNNGTLTPGTAASGVTSAISYTGGNGGTYIAQIINSTGVTGLTATLTAGTLAMGNGALNFTITGTPASSGTASFAINIGGQSCTFTRTVGTVTTPTYPAGTVHCGTPTAIVEVTSTTGRIWMDRNLGASRMATSSTDDQAYGDLYQWGRRADGHQCRNSGTTSTLSSTDQPAHGNFIITSSGNIDWRSPQNNNLWQGVNGVNNPCPLGYRIPSIVEWSNELQSWTEFSANGAYSSPLKLTIAGFRWGHFSGGINTNEQDGLYWSNSTAGSNASFLRFYSSGTALTQSYYRVTGISVRCIKN